MLREEDIRRNWDSSKPLVSIRCTTYNHEKYISQCLEGFLMQETNFPFEVIVHDDASTDATPAIIKEYETKYPSIIKPIYEVENQYSKGVASLVRNINSHMRGKYIASCEGDDYWCDKDKLQKQFDFLEAHNEYFAVGHLTKAIDANGDELRDSFINSKIGEYTVEDNGRWQLFAHFSSYFSRNYLKIVSSSDYEKYLKVECAGDRKFPVLFFRYGRLYVLPFVGSVYRYQSCATSYSSNAKYHSAIVYYKECNSLSLYSASIGLNINYAEYRAQLILFAFQEWILRRDKKSFGEICSRMDKKQIIEVVRYFPAVLKRKVKRSLHNREQKNGFF